MITKIFFEHDEIHKHTQKFIRIYMNEIHLMNKYTISRAELMHEFKIKKNEIHKKDCEGVLKYVFCFDIKKFNT